jgi:hypothetical protein
MEVQKCKARRYSLWSDGGVEGGGCVPVMEPALGNHFRGGMAAKDSGMAAAGVVNFRDFQNRFDPD